MSKGKKQKAAPPLPELQDGATTSNGPTALSQRTGSVGRLPSLLPKRDLTLGAPWPQKPPKKVFTPTIPARRKKLQPVPLSPSIEAAVSHERGKGRGRESGRGRRGRRERDVVTSASVFSMGPSEKLAQRRESRGDTFEGVARVNKPEKPESTYKVKSESKVRYQFPSSDEEEDGGAGEKMEVGEEDQVFPGSQRPPVQLPLDRSLHARHRAVISRAKVKLDSGDSATAAAAATTPVKLVKPVAESSANQTQPRRMTAAQLFTTSEGSKGQFLFFQLPDCVPLGNTREDEVAMDTSMASQTQSASTSAASTSVKKEETGEASQRLPSLRDLPDGHIGKLRIHKSGKVKLVLGDTTLDVALGTPCGFLQELVSIRTDQEQPRMTVLGQMTHRLVCTPDFESLLSHNNDRQTADDYDSSEQHR